MQKIVMIDKAFILFYFLRQCVLVNGLYLEHLPAIEMPTCTKENSAGTHFLFSPQRIFIPKIFKKILCVSQYGQVLFFSRRFLGFLRFDLRRLCRLGSFHYGLFIRSTFHRALVGGVVGEDDVEEETVVEASTTSSTSSFLLVRVFRGFP